MKPRMEGYCEEIINFLPDATLVIDSDGYVIAWNREMERLTHVPASAMLGKGNYEYALPFYNKRQPMLANLVLLPDDEVEKRYHSVERDGDTLVVDIFIPVFGKNGAYFWAKASPLYDPAGNVVGAIETIRDITDRIRSREEMRRTGQRLAEIIDFLPDATFVIDSDGFVISWNKAMEELTGVPGEEMLGKGKYEYALPFYGVQKPMLANLVLMPEEEVEARYDTVERDNDTLVVDIFIPTFGKDGTYFWAKACPLYDSSGNIVGAIEGIRDISDRKKAEQESENARLKLAEIINFLPDAAVVIDTKGIVQAWNHEMELLSRVPAREMLGKGDYEYSIPFYGEKRPILADIVLKPARELESDYAWIGREGDTLVVDTFLPKAKENGGFFWAKACPLYDSGGMVIGAIETIRDITERREMEERLARSKAELDIAAEIQQSFLPDTIPAITGFDIAARCVMAKEVGGDFFDVIPFELVPLQRGTLGVLIADVSGKGVPAALFMALSRIVVRVNATWYPRPDKVINSANSIISKDSRAGMFVTLFYGIISEEERSITYVNAGHNPPLVYRHKGDSFEELKATGIAMGVLDDEKYEQRTVRINPGDLIVLYTDGITESINCNTEMYGDIRLRSVIRRSASLSADLIVESILNEVLEFCGDEQQFDDSTLLVIKG
ncbi:MAG: SpoIIE family protein phosphatase [Methanospirillaceae archaeon]|nr:SpoIIE family protein phosphatase [Methanospirillaceae archaeon]